VSLVTLLVVAACAVSFADVAHAATDPCGPDRGWGPAKVDGSSSAKPLLAIPTVPVALVDVSGPAPRWVSVEDVAPASSRIILVRSLAPRAPPLV
jgi:hypothetical protein